MSEFEYMEFFDRWLNYQFPRAEDVKNNYEILKKVSRIISDPDDLEYWSRRDCWSMYDLAKVSPK